MRLSGSKMGLAFKCLYWTTQPWPDDPSGDAATNGSWYHGVTCATINGAEPPPAPACLGDANEWTPIDDAQELVHELLMDNYDPERIKAEPAYVYSPSGTRFLGFDIGRNYGDIADDEIPCSLDVVAVDGTRAVVVDWKTGRRENVEPAEMNKQLAFGALCVADYHGVTEVEVQIRFADGGVWRHVYDAFDLLDIRADVNALIATTDPQPQPGLHCTSKWCPIRATCPKTQEIVAEIMEPPTDDYPLAVDVAAGESIVSPVHAASLWNRAAAARALLDKIDSAIKAYVDENGAIPLGDGKEYRQVEETRESISANDPKDIYHPLSPFLTPEQFAPCIAVSVPKTNLEKAVKANADGPKGKAWIAAMDALRNAGFVRSKTTTSHRVKTIKGAKV